MNRWTDLATWRGPTVNEGDGDGHPGEPEDHRSETRGLVLHIAEGSGPGTISWQLNPSAQVSSHFVVDLDGSITQMVDLDDRAWTQIEGNRAWLSVENAGHTPHPLTDAQVEANAQLLARCHTAFGVPLELATSPSGRGLGHHSMGAESGVNWGHSDCPGPAIKAQKPAILARAIEIINGGNDMALTDDDVQKVAAATVHLLLTGLSLPVKTPTMSAGSAMLSGQQHAASADAKLDAIAEQLTGLPAAVVAALPPVVGVTSTGDFTVTGTLHVDGAAAP